MYDVQTVILLCGVGLPTVLVGAVLWLQRRASDQRAEERHSELLSLFSRPAEVPAVSHAPDSSRIPTATGAFLAVPRAMRPPGLSEEQRDRIVARLSVRGTPRTAAEYAAIIGVEFEPDLRAPAGPGYVVWPGVVSYRADERAERNLLEGVIVAAIGELPHTREDVLAIAARLTAPAIVSTKAK